MLHFLLEVFIFMEMLKNFLNKKFNKKHNKKHNKKFNKKYNKKLLSMELKGFLLINNLSLKYKNCNSLK